MKKHYLLIFILLSAFAGPMRGQVNEFATDATSNSIIRAIDDDSQLIYSEDASGQGSFVLYRQGVVPATAFNIPAGMHIRDVRIWNKKEAYFCGTSNGGGVVGMFNIFPLFAGSGVMNYAVYVTWSGNGWVKVHDLKRLDLFESYDAWGNTVNLALVGTSTFFDPGTTQGTSVSSAWFDGTHWRFNTFFNKGYDYTYTDVACLDDVVVVTATDPGGGGCYIRTYQAVNDFLAHYYISDVIYEIVFPTSIGDVLAAHIDGNKAVLAHFVKQPAVETVLHEVHIDTLTGQPQATIPSWITVTGAPTPGRMDELRVAQGKFPYVLQKAEYASVSYPGVHDWLVQFQLTYAPYTASLWYPDRMGAQSMDLDVPFQQPLLSGQGPRLRTYQSPWASAVTACVPYDTAPVRYSSATWREAHTDTSYDTIRISNSVHVPVLFQMPVVNVCE